MHDKFIAFTCWKVENSTFCCSQQENQDLYPSDKSLSGKSKKTKKRWSSRIGTQCPKSTSQPSRSPHLYQWPNWPTIKKTKPRSSPSNWRFELALVQEHPPTRWVWGCLIQRHPKNGWKSWLDSEKFGIRIGSRPYSCSDHQWWESHPIYSGGLSSLFQPSKA